ncbi:hypothetical protein APUTEX25_003716, partial [Auxenochlorella protothecoides]
PADEADFLELLIASERVEEWLEVVQNATLSDTRLIRALKDMLEAVIAKEAYVEEARHSRVASRLTAMLKRIGPDQEEAADLAADIIAACSGSAAASGGVVQARYAGGVSITLMEGALGDGVGARLWVAAHILNRLLAAHPDMVAGRSVLELGAGCGACGLAAARLGAARVVLTDYLDAVLLCLVTSMHLTLGEGPGEGAPQKRRALMAAEAATEGWEAGCAAVRFLDWNAARGPVRAASSEPPPPSVAPPMGPADERFEVILGTDILYEGWMAASVAAVLEERLAEGGGALICCAVREQAIFTEFEAEVASRAMRLTSHPAQPQPQDMGVKGREWDYEGGFRLMIIDRPGSPWAGAEQLRLES